jgi:hypothetical protein
MDTKPLSFRQLQLVWLIALVLVPLYVLITETYAVPHGRVLTSWHWGIAALGLWAAWGGYSVRTKLMARATAESSGAKAAKKWSAAQLVGLMSGQGVVLWGIVAKLVLGSPRWFSACFYVAGTALLIVWRPEKKV